METSTKQNIFLTSKSLRKWESVSGKQSWFARLLSEFWQRLEVYSLQTRLRTLSHRVYQIYSVGKNNINVTLDELSSNNRVLVGSVLMVMVAPVAYWAHLLFINPELTYRFPLAFIEDPIQEGWHYKRIYYWYFMNREEFMFASALTGYFLIQPIKSGYKYLLIPLIAACVCEIIFQSALIETWEDFYVPMLTWKRGFELVVFVLTLAFAVYKFISYSVYRKYHLKDGNAARIMGIFNLPISWDDKKKHFEALKEEMENFNSRV